MTSEDQTAAAAAADTVEARKLPNGYTRRGGIVYGPDGKPCRSCNSYRDMAGMSKALISSTSSTGNNTNSSTSKSALSSLLATSSTTSSVSTYPKDCPPDVESLGSASWTLLHTLSASYPAAPTPTQKSEMSTFLKIFSRIYPCGICAEDFASYISSPSTAPKLDSQEDFGKWMCEAHNEVNRKLGKEEFDCKFWKERWRDGWGDGRC